MRLANQGNPIFPYDWPANIAFNGQRSILVTNHAFVTGGTNPEQFTVLDCLRRRPRVAAGDAVRF